MHYTVWRGTNNGADDECLTHTFFGVAFPSDYPDQPGGYDEPVLYREKDALKLVRTQTQMLGRFGYVFYSKPHEG